MISVVHVQNHGKLRMISIVHVQNQRVLIQLVSIPIDEEL